MARLTLEFVLDAVEVAVVAATGGALGLAASSAALRVAAAESASAAIDRSPTNVALSAARTAAEDTSEAFEDFVRSQSRLLDIVLDPRAAAPLMRAKGGWDKEHRKCQHRPYAGPCSLLFDCFAH